MTVDFEWKDEYLVGVELLDSQHKYMFELGKQISHLRPAQTKKVIVELYRYIMQHFATEEAHMRAIRYPAAEQHRSQHEYIIDQLNIMSAGFEANERNTLKLKLFLFNWLSAHILREDKKYFEYSQILQNNPLR